MQSLDKDDSSVIPIIESSKQDFFFFIKYKQNLRIEIISRSNKAQYVWIPRVPSSCFSLSAGRNSPKHILSQFLTFQDLMNWWFPKISAISKLICLSSFWVKALKLTELLFQDYRFPQVDQRHLGKFPQSHTRNQF